MARNFIIIDPDPIVSLDLEGLLVSQFPDADIILFRTAEETASTLTVMSPQTTLFVRGAMYAEHETVARLVRAAVEAGSSVVIIGTHTGTDIPVKVVDLPFTNEAILEKVITPPITPTKSGPHEQSA